MKTVLILAALVGLAVAGTVPPKHDVELKTVDADFIAKQKKILSFFENVGQVNTESELYKIGKEFDIEKHADFFKNKKAFEEFLVLYKEGFMPKYEVFSVFYDRMREEAVALFHLFYYAKDFETFYKTAAWAQVHFNEYQFIYSFYIAVLLRPDCRGLVVPAPYEVYPEFFTNSETMYKAYRLKMQDDIHDTEMAKFHGIEKEGDSYIFYANYSSHWTYDSEEMRLSYFTEDVGLNAFYYYFHSYFPFWMEGDDHGIFKERRGERYYFFYQQLLARYYLERLANGLGEIEDFSWYHPIKKGFSPLMSTSAYPFIQRNEYYHMKKQENLEDIRFLDSYEKIFQQYLQRGHFKAFDQEVDFHNSKAINFVGNFWQTNKDLYEKTGHRNYQRSYEAIARHLLSAAPEQVDDHTVAPTALSFYQTSLRDPVFYQLYSKIIKYFLQYKEYLEPYTQENLHFVGVKINDVHVDKLVTFFDFFEYDATNAVYKNVDEMKQNKLKYKIRQPRLNHKPFNVEIDVKSDVETEAVFKIFIGPKYDHNNYPITLEDNWMNFVELDWFKQKLTPGQNKIKRASEDFFWFKEDSVSVTQIYEYLKQNKVPKDMSDDYEFAPNRLMLPKGLEGGFPFQFYVFAYPYQAPGKEYEQFEVLVDSKTFGYPLDRPVSEYHFMQPNMFFKDVEIYFEGERMPYSLNNPFYFKNEVPKH